MRAGTSLSFACDSKSIITKWYAKLYASAPLDVQPRMRLYTSETEIDIEEDWTDLIIFYSPKITTGVDITCINSSEQFIYITGQSVSSINLLQMATRTRNMTQLNYYSSARSCESLYESFEDCEKKLTEKYVVNQLGYSENDIEDFKLDQNYWRSAELIHLNMYIRNSYVLDLHKTNILYFFEQELKNCGFSIESSIGSYAKMIADVTIDFKEQTQKIRDDKYDLLLKSFDPDPEEPKISLPKSLLPMKERCQLLNLTTVEEVTEYREVVEDSLVLDQFYNYNGLKKSLEYCECKVSNTINAKMIARVEKNKWFKIKYVHLLADLCGIENNLFSIDEIEMPTKLTEKDKKLIKNIKTLYNKRDATEVDEYDVDSIKQLYKFMLDSLTKKLKLYSKSRDKSRGEVRDKTSYELNEEAVNKYDNLIEILNKRYLIEEQGEEE